MLTSLLPALAWSLALAAATPAQQQEAKDLSRRSIVEYNGGEFEKALADIQRAYDLDPREGLLFNLAQCHRALEHWRKAKYAYEAYLRELPDAPNRKLVRTIIEELEGKLREQEEKEQAARAAQRPPERIQTTVPIILTPPPAAGAPPVAFAPFTEPEPVPVSHTGRVAGWTLGAIGVAGAGVGTVLGVMAQNVFGQGAAPVSSQCPSSNTCYNYTYAQYNSASTQQYAADVLWGVGGALVVTGVILLLTSN